MANTCVICGRSNVKLVTNPSHPSKPVCLDCVNAIIFNIHTIEEELDPFAKALAKALASFKEEWEKEQKQ